MSVKPKLPSKGISSNTGALHMSAKFDKPMRAMPQGLAGMNSTKSDIGEMSGFAGGTESYIVKKGTPFGESAKFNFLPPGMDISNQENVDIRDMPFREVTGVSYPGDGWEPVPRDIDET